MTGVGFAFNWGDLTLTSCQLGYVQIGDKLLQNFCFSGPAVGVNLHF